MKVTISGTSYEILQEIGTWDYSWTIGALLRGPDGGLHFAVDAGCSCTSYGDDLTVEDLTSVSSWQEAVEVAKTVPSPYGGDTPVFTDVEVYEFARQLALG